MNPKPARIAIKYKIHTNIYLEGITIIIINAMFIQTLCGDGGGSVYKYVFLLLFHCMF